jgi:hypothetical protein
MNIEEIHDIIYVYLNKAQQGFISHEEIDAVLDRSQMSIFNLYHANPMIYTVPGRKESLGYSDSQRMDDALSPFKKTYTYTTGDTPGGVVTLPNDYMHMISLYTTQYVDALGRNVVNPVQVLAEDELIERLESQVIPVSLFDPICIMNSGKKIQLFPEVPQSGKVYYFKRPAVPKFAYTQSGRTVTYDAGNSVQLEWNEADINNIIMQALSYYGLNLNSAELIQFAQLKQQTGQ